MKQIINRRNMSVLVMGLALWLVVGCDTPPRGSSGSRRDPYRTTAAERHDPRPLPAALTEYSDQVAESVARDLARISQDQQTPGRITVILGDIINKTGNVRSDEFELVRSRIRNLLLQSDYVRDQVKFVENRARMSRLAERERVASEGFFADPDDYDPKATYVLNGEMYRIHRGEINQYYFEFQLSHFASNEIVFSDRYDLKQVRQ